MLPQCNNHAPQVGTHAPAVTVDTWNILHYENNQANWTQQALFSSASPDSETALLEGPNAQNLEGHAMGPYLTP
jgi:hypothetical protein